MPRRTGQKKKPSCCCGQSRSTAGARTSLPRSWARMIGSKLLVLFLAGMTHSASISSIKIKSLPFRKATGSKEKTKNS